MRTLQAMALALVVIIIGFALGQWIGPIGVLLFFAAALGVGLLVIFNPGGDGDRGSESGTHGGP